MINRLHSLFHRPERGWDPISAEYARGYAEEQWRNISGALIDELEQRIGGLANKRILDLGAGPGQYSVAFARRGAQVTWHDVSRAYQKIASKHAADAGVGLSYSLGYLDEAGTLIAHPFDLVFTRLAWCYCMNDRAFAELIYSLVRPGGAAYIDTNTPAFESIRGLRHFLYFFNDHFGLKIGHPHPPHGRIATLLHRYAIDFMILDYSSHLNDRIFFVKSRVIGA